MEKGVVEKRVRPTLIRRRAKPIEASEVIEVPPIESEPLPEPKEGEAVESQVSLPKEGEKKEELPKVAVIEEKKKKIGLVGHIDEIAPKAKSDKPSVVTPAITKRVAKKKKSRDELDREDIERAGGLKSYATLFAENSEETAGYSVDKERVFRPGLSRRKKIVSGKKPIITERKESKKVIRLEKTIEVGKLSQSLGVKIGDIISKLMNLGVMASINQPIEAETAEIIANEYGFRVEKVGIKEEEILGTGESKPERKNLIRRQPVVTVMGHVDHGKTSILDVIRKTKVADGEAGGITQHIGAYEVHLKGGAITFIDTPGHEAFTSMRARGAQVTDLVVLVVAADDGVMPQTIEAIDHAKAAGVPILVAVNKIDKSNAQPDRVKQQLAEHGLVSEDWGGETIFVHTSALKKQGIDQLLEMILLQSEVLDLKSDSTVRPMGIVIEARLDKGRGPVATVIIKEGTLKKGDFVVCGEQLGRVRGLLDFVGKDLKQAGPSIPVEILGLSGVPNSGDELISVEDEKSARELISNRKSKRRTDALTGLSMSSLEDLQKGMVEGEIKELNLVVKADVRGTVDAVAASIEKLSSDKVKVNVVHHAVGGISESDVMLAAASKAIVVGFNVMPDGKGREASDRTHVEIRTYKIIYELLEDIEKAMKGMLAPRLVESVIGRAQVREIFKVSKIGTIAGCMVTSGKIIRNAKARLLRDSTVVFEGAISSLKRFKDDAKEVVEGYECGIGIEGYNDLKVGDEIEAYIIESKPQE